MSSIFYNFLESIKQALRNKTEEIIKRLIKVITIVLIGFLFLLMGLFHLSIGIINYFTIVFGSAAISYSSVGSFLILLGIIVLLVAMPRH